MSVGEGSQRWAGMRGMRQGKSGSQAGLSLGRERASAWVPRAGFLEEMIVLPGAATQSSF